MNYTNDQSNALAAITEFLKDDSEVFILRGYAGTGKTTLINPIIDIAKVQGYDIALMAPTGRAAKILREKTGMDATTIHSSIYTLKIINVDDTDDGIRSVKYIFPLRQSIESHVLYIVDEASMVSSKVAKEELFSFGSGVVLNDLLTYATNSKILFIGDPAQLPPVGDSCSCALNDTYFKERHIKVQSAELHDIVRQDGKSTILSNAMSVRDLLSAEHRTDLQFRFRPHEFEEISIIDIAEDFTNTSPQPDTDGPKVICFENKVARALNSRIRSVYFPGAGDVPRPGDVLQIVHNCGTKGVYNGDFATVLNVSDTVEQQSAPVYLKNKDSKESKTIQLDFRDVTLKTDDGRIIETKIIDTLLRTNQASLSPDENTALFINFRMRHKGLSPKDDNYMDLLRSDPYYNALHVKFGYAITCHKAQGGEWDTVYVDYGSRTGLNDDCLRWCYTATTRARKLVKAISAPHITLFDKIHFAQTQVCTKAPEGYYPLNNVPTTPFHSDDSDPAARYKCLCIIEALEGTGYNLAGVESKPWREIYHIENGECKIRIDGVYNKSGMFSSFTCAEHNEKAHEALALITSAEGKLEHNYVPSAHGLALLYESMSRICNETESHIMNVIEKIKNYKVTYCLKTSGAFSYIDFSINKNFAVTFAQPHSDLGECDEKLNDIITKLSK